METRAALGKNGALKVNFCPVERFTPARDWNKSEAGDRVSSRLVRHEVENNPFVRRITALIEANLDDETYGIVQLCMDFGISRSQLHRNLVTHTCLSASKYIRSIRIWKAVELLLYSDLNISEIAYEVGFSDPKYFSRLFTKEFNQSPRDFRKTRWIENGL